MRWVGYPDGLRYDEAQLEGWLATTDASPDRHHFVVRDHELGFCGELFYKVDDARRRAALDVKLATAAQGRGIATTGLSWLIDTVFAEEPHVEVVWTEPWPENEQARRLYRRCGLRPQRRPRGLGASPLYWALSRRTWLARGRSAARGATGSPRRRASG